MGAFSQMINKYLFAVLLFCIVLTIPSGKAQSDLGTYFLSNTWASAQLNPSFSDSAKIQISLPILNYQLYSSPDIKLSDILYKSNGENILNLDGVVDKLESENTFISMLDVQTLGLGFRVNKLFLNLSHRIRLNSTIDYSDQLAQLIWNGNSQYIGQTVDFGPNLLLNTFHEMALGFTYPIIDKLTLGAKFKFLSGIGSIETINSDASLYTSDDIYQLTFNSDYQIRTSSILNINGISDFSFDLQGLTFQNFISTNTGYGIDFGFNYQATDKLNISASVIDIGKINWKENSSLYSSTGSYVYEGTDLSNFFSEEDLDFNVKLDTLEEIFEFQKQEDISFETKLNSTFYIGGQYKLNDNIVLAALYRNVFGNNQNLSAFALNGQYQFGNKINVGLNYAYKNEEGSSIGIMAVLRFGPLQVYGSTDNIIGLAEFNNRINGRLGVALLF